MGTATTETLEIKPGDIVRLDEGVNDHNRGGVLSSYWPAWSQTPVTVMLAPLYDYQPPRPGSLCKVVAVINRLNKPYFLKELAGTKADYYSEYDFSLVLKGSKIQAKRRNKLDGRRIAE